MENNANRMIRHAAVCRVPGSEAVQRHRLVMVVGDSPAMGKPCPFCGGPDDMRCRCGVC